METTATMTIASLRDALTDLGVSSTTPGLRGDERRAVLQDRYVQAVGGPSSASSTTTAITMNDGRSMTDLRRDLEQRGVNTSTPGLRGEDRRVALLQRWHTTVESKDPKQNEARSNQSGDGHGAADARVEDSDAMNLPPPSTSPMKKTVNLKARAAQLKGEIQAIQKARADAIAAQLGTETVSFWTQKLLDVDQKRHESTGDTTALAQLEVTLQGQLQAANDKEVAVRQKAREHPEHGLQVEQEKAQSLRSLQEDIKRQGIQGFKELVGHVAAQETTASSSPTKAKQTGGRANPLMAHVTTSLNDQRRRTLPSALARAGSFSTPAQHGASSPQRDRIQSFPAMGAPIQSLSDAEKLGRKAFFMHNLKGDMVAAEAAYNQAIELEPTHAVNLSHYALFLDHIQKRHDDAEEFYLRAVDAAPSDNASALSNYANFLNRVRHDPVRAAAYYERCLQEFPHDVCNLGNYANFLRYAKQDLATAKVYFDQAVALDPKHINNLSQYASLLCAMGKLEHADAYYQKALQLNCDNSTICSNYANLLLKRKQLAPAKAYYLRAIKLDPENMNAQQNYALFLRDHPSMRTGVTRKIKMHPKDRWVQLKQDTTHLVKASNAFKIK
ncbi:Aste57867_18695 [Aphanomyces stellatus]|uniref:Aste57867_18695 protein n=1 Tax=Aphanomyces stellatus TaxID=120398 RepID=A0A485LBM9_9STRA|nr:hypothetical protein As57867_018633 [Aphanomyces stellatus]VFT95430.1 Aste57867_18695 [Aphanomyces stellatus]